MADYNTANGQTPYDIAIQLYGSVEYVGEVAKHLTTLSTPITANTVLPLENEQNNAITQFFAGRKPVATEHFSGGYPFTYPFEQS